MTIERHYIQDIDPMLTENLIARAEFIRIVSGEGEIGTREDYTGKRTLRALRSRLTKERCHGDRWAYAEIQGVNA